MRKVILTSATLLLCGVGIANATDLQCDNGFHLTVDRAASTLTDGGSVGPIHFTVTAPSGVLQAVDGPEVVTLNPFTGELNEFERGFTPVHASCHVITAQF